jgi:hypothetical protein
MRPKPFRSGDTSDYQDALVPLAHISMKPGSLPISGNCVPLVITDPKVRLE